MDVMSNLDSEIIAPQHGSIFKEEGHPFYHQQAEDLSGGWHDAY